MSSYGIVCEYNPFHDGHKHLIEQTRKATKADTIVCAMSGSLVQRGDVAIFDKWQRAKWAIENGADLVVEIPCEYVLQSADSYAFAGVSLLNHLGVCGIAFGSECDDKDAILNASMLKLQKSDLYNETVKEMLTQGQSYPKACENALKKIMPYCPDSLFLPNATLGICYVDSALKINPNLDFCIIKRTGSYHSDNINTPLPSATAIRKQLLNNSNFCGRDKYQGCTPRDINAIAPLILGFLRIAKPQNLKKITSFENGLPERVIQCAKNATNLNDLFEMCSSKRYTTHRIRRFILCSLLGIETLHPINYIRVLAMNQKGMQVLKSTKQNSAINIVTKTADYKYRPEDAFAKDILATDIASLCSNEPAGKDFTTSPITL